ncbi:pre-mRNA-splicing factor ATP-dependent RNA helicase DEAH1 [Mercurialis annua]|uniref:pre-mRNA-splicing factor ATP-dependent RNA helicase DEAH1 n=1 Tax=Mercurialis annua TaxID=3986 RepID=UPI002160A7C2|nr:pre-mRNA-splicing factor ATP-dependent RNA helicase DEAH1 [Mercurialis annua]
MLDFDFMDPPSNESLLKALELLFALGALNSKGELTKLGRSMAEFPLDPKLSKALIASEKYGCSEEIMTIAAMLSVGNAIFYRPKDKHVLADNAKKSFEYGDVGDHIALLRVYNSWEESSFSSLWCYEHFVQFKSMNRARDIREQLKGLTVRAGINLKSNSSDLKAIKKSIISGFFPHIATFQASGSYRTLRSPQIVDIHPNSGLARAIPQPKWIVYHELVLTGKKYMRQVTEAKPEWLLEIAPHYFDRTEVKESALNKHKKHLGA